MMLFYHNLHDPWVVGMKIIIIPEDGNIRRRIIFSLHHVELMFQLTFILKTAHYMISKLRGVNEIHTPDDHVMLRFQLNVATEQDNHRIISYQT